MPLIENELRVLPVGELLKLEIALPEYQRPYRWNSQSVNVLFDDIRTAMINNSQNEYRLGAVVLCKCKNEQDGNLQYEIVDGQQRITTLTMLIKILFDVDDDEIPKNLLDNAMKLQYTKNSLDAMNKNYSQLFSRANELSINERKDLLRYIVRKCTLVSIVTDSQAEAFQFFDSQNHRGKDLAPHDLLKAYHLREMSDETESVKLNVIDNWEGYAEDDLKNLFANHLYPLTRWYLGRDGLNYSKADVKQFKGSSKGISYNYALYHKAANLFIEDINRYHKDLYGKDLNQFQLTQPLVAGTRFFKYVTHYMLLKSTIEQLIVIIDKDYENLLPNIGNGNKYLRQLFVNTLMFFADRFGIEAINETVYNRLFSYCFVLRVTMQAVQEKTVNKYVLGFHAFNVEHINVFEEINNMTDPSEISGIIVGKPDSFVERYTKKDGGKFRNLYERICKISGWEID